MKPHDIGGNVKKIRTQEGVKEARKERKEDRTMKIMKKNGK